jgi:hypothetical protein
MIVTTLCMDVVTGRSKNSFVGEIWRVFRMKERRRQWGRDTCFPQNYDRVESHFKIGNKWIVLCLVDNQLRTAVLVGYRYPRHTAISIYYLVRFESGELCELGLASLCLGSYDVRENIKNRIEVLDYEPRDLTEYNLDLGEEEDGRD